MPEGDGLWCPACGRTGPPQRPRVPFVARLDPLALAVAGRGLYRCPHCGHEWAADDEPPAEPAEPRE